MRRLIWEYRQFFEVPDETKDSIVIARILAFVVLLFILGFVVGKKIIN